jgi:thioredoxin reductase (NADPH)
MSRYLTDRIEATPNMEALTRTDVTGVLETSEGELERVRWRTDSTGEETEKPIRNRAELESAWLSRYGLSVDNKGIVRIGSETGSDGPSVERQTSHFRLETTVPRVFAIGDIRTGSVKRVGPAIGEGAAVVPEVHAKLARASQVAVGGFDLRPGTRPFQI